MHISPKLAEELQKKSARALASETMRKQQQGLGKPIIATEFKDTLVVAVGSVLYTIPKGKTFPDFLKGYLPLKMGLDWFSQEENSRDVRHPLIEWRNSLQEHHKKHLKAGQRVISAPGTGSSNCYLGLAYSLYLLEHNVDLQQRLINRLKDRNNFQGAYYELIVANCLIRSGFNLVLEDETDESQKHCEFSAISAKTGKKYWVEAKARSVVDVLCKTSLNGTTDTDPTGRLSAQVSNAFKKPANDLRLIFVDVNTPDDNKDEPDWVDRAETKLNAKERDRKPQETAYVFVTNMSFHYHLDDAPRHSLFAYGFGIPDFAKAGQYSLSEMYRLRQKHLDAHEILQSFQEYPKIPNTTDGSLPSEKFVPINQRVLIGEKYLFEGIGEATIASATVHEATGTAYFGTTDGRILTKQLSPEELADYKSHRSTFFGVVHEQGKKAETPYELFEHMVTLHLKYSEEDILQLLMQYPDAEELRTLCHEDRVLAYCERLVLLS